MSEAFRILLLRVCKPDVHGKLYCVYVSYAVNLCTNAYRKLYNTVCTHMWSVENWHVFILLVQVIP